MKSPKLLENSTNIASLFFGLSVLISVIYEYSFFKTFGISLAQLPSSISDHLKSSIDIYFYSSLVCAFFLILIGVVEHRRSLGVISPEGVQAFTKSRIRRIVDLIFGAWFAYYYTFILLNHSDELSYVFVRTTSLIVVVLVIYNFLSVYFESLFGFINAHKILMFFICVAIIYHVGIYDALVIKEGRGVQVTYGKVNVNSNYYLVKTFSSHYVFWDKNGNQLIYEPVSEIDSLSISGK